MTGADHFNELLIRAQHIANGAPAEHRATLMMNFLQGAVIGCSARLLEENDFAAAYDVITMGSHAICSLGGQLLHDPEVAEMVPSMVARFHGADVPLGPPQHPSPPHGNALSAAELEALGLDPEPPTLADVVEEKSAGASDNLGDPERYQFHESPRSATYAPLDFRCAREGADGIACTDERWHVNVAMMQCGPLVRFLCAEHCRREVAWAFPETEYVMHEAPNHLAFNRRRKPKART